MRFAVRCLLVWSVTVAPASAWNATGHKIIASIAFRQFTAAEQSKIVEILKRHPRFDEDFVEHMPDDVRRGTEAGQNEWLFQQAAIWSDTVRSGTPEKRAFNRSEWHYINLPVFLTDAAQAELSGRLRANVAMEPPTGATPNTPAMNVVQAIRFARRQLADNQTTPDIKGMLLAWLFHDVGDIHQPLHSSALYSVRLFPEGDRGGNSIKTRQQGNLHALWDNFPGRSDTFHDARNKAIAHNKDGDLLRLGAEAARNLDEKAWLDESHALAKSAAYDIQLLDALRSMEAAGGAVQELMMSEPYLKAGGSIAEQRVVEAGYRLGAVLRQITGK
jgi:hypothetical protein